MILFIKRQIIEIYKGGRVVLFDKLIITYKIPVLGTHKKLLLLRGFLGVFSLVFFFQSLKQFCLLPLKHNKRHV